MAVATMTLQEVLAIPGIDLFDKNIPYMDYPHVQQEIIDTYITREIAYETPMLFKLKLNNALRLRCDSYNKMLRSQLIEFDPFVTEYMETLDRSDAGTAVRGSNQTDYSDAASGETYNWSETDTTDKLSNVQNEDTTSEHASAEAIHATEITDSTTNTHTRTDIHETTASDERLTSNEDVNLHETTNTTEDTSSTDKLTERTAVHSDQGTLTDQTTTENQTGLTWTEKGTSQGHNLNVHSDTPNLMLFNEPNHYYGAGRAHDYGKVVTDADGSEHYEHYPETEPSAIDEGSYQIGSEDTPWFNYATSADNATGHDSYDKEGTETYQRNGTSNVSTKRTEDTVTDHGATTDFTQNVTGHVNHDANTTTDFESDKHTDASLDRNETTDTTATTHAEDTKDSTDNLRESSKGHRGQTTEETAKGNEQGRDGGTSKSARAGSNSAHTATDTDTHANRSIVRKGRAMRTPADLLTAYRGTLTYNADMWLLGELSNLFLELY